MRREQVTGFRLNSGKIRKYVPESISFFNDNKEKILEITITKNSKDVFIHPKGADITMFDNDEYPLVKLVCGKQHLTKAVTTRKTFNYSERVFDQKKRKNKYAIFKIL